MINAGLAGSCRHATNLPMHGHSSLLMAIAQLMQCGMITHHFIRNLPHTPITWSSWSGHLGYRLLLGLQSGDLQHIAHEFVVDFDVGTHHDSGRTVFSNVDTLDYIYTFRDRQ